MPNALSMFGNYADTGYLGTVIVVDVRVHLECQWRMILAIWQIVLSKSIKKRKKKSDMYRTHDRCAVAICFEYNCYPATP